MPLTLQNIIDNWQKKSIKTDADLDAVVNGQAVSLAYHTNKLEYREITFYDTREVFENGRVINYTGNTRTLFAMQNAKNAWELFMECFSDKKPLSEELVKEFHRELTIGTYDERRYRHGERPGEYKHGNFVTGRYEVGAPPEDVSEEMVELLDELKDVPDNGILTAAAYFHVKFENIHPFADGNGRTGRLLMNYFLVCHNYPVIVIHEEDRREYMAALESWDKDQDLKPMRHFLEQQMIKTWDSK